MAAPSLGFILPALFRASAPAVSAFLQKADFITHCLLRSLRPNTVASFRAPCLFQFLKETDSKIAWGAYDTHH